MPVADGGGLDGVLLALPGDKRPPPHPVGPWPPHLGLGPVQAQLDALGGSVGEHVGQGVQPHAGGVGVGDGKATAGQQRPDLMHRAGDGGAVDPIQHRQGLVRQLEAQDHQRDQDPVIKHQAVVRAGTLGTLAWVAAALLEGGLVDSGPGVGQLGGQVGQVLPRQPGEDSSH